MARDPNYIIPPGHTEGESAVGPTRSYRVTPQRTTDFVEGLRRGAVDLKFHSNGGDNESSLDLGSPNFLNGGRYGYRKVRRGPYTEAWQTGRVGSDGRNTEHFHISEGVANASAIDIINLHKRVLNHGDDNTMSVTDKYGNIAVFGRPETLRKRGFPDRDFMDFEDEDGVRKELYKQGLHLDAYTPFKKVVVPNR